MASGSTSALDLRLARVDDVDTLQAIELDAARAYAAYPATSFCVDLPARDAAEHRHARERGLALAAEVCCTTIGFLLAVPADGRAHLLELAVGHRFQRRGYGRQIIAAFEVWAYDAGYREATLTTFRDVPWNAPFYRDLGYRGIVVGHDRTELAGRVAEEQRAGIHRAPRLAMSKELVRRGS